MCTTLWHKWTFSEDFHNGRSGMHTRQFLIGFICPAGCPQLPADKIIIQIQGDIVSMVIVKLRIRDCSVIANPVQSFIDHVYGTPVDHRL